MKWTAGVLLAVMPLGILWVYFHRQELKIPLAPPGSKKEERVEKGRVKCTVITSIGDRTSLRLKVAIPYKDPSQRDDLMKKTPRIQHDLVLLLTQPDMEAVLRTRDFPMLKRRIAQIINRSAERPVETVYLENFFLN